MLKKYDYNKLHKNYTYLFEIIYQENRIVCQYDFEDLVLLGMIETNTGHEVNLYDEHEDVRFKILIFNVGLKVVQRFDKFKDFQYLKQTIPDNKEGYVVKFSNGDRMKIKGEEYLRLHKIITNISTTSVWEVLSNGGKMEDLLKDVPDEFYDKIKSYEKDLRYTHFSISEDAGKRFDYFMYGKYNDKEPVTDKKEYAMWVLKQPQHLQPILFRMFDKKEYSSYIWKLIKPKFKKL
jgi:RNA ligase